MQCETMSGPSGVTILVTGGAGFLGQHIVKELMEQGTVPVREIRTFDVQPFKWNDGVQCPSNDSVKLNHITGNICDSDAITEACRGVNVVIHNCSAIAYGPYPDERQLHAVNVEGTEKTISACERNNVEYLVYTSTIEIANDLANPGVEQTEETANVPAVAPVFPAYALTKYSAEKLVLDAHNRVLSDGKRLNTCSLRPCGIYGEGERIINGNLETFVKSGVSLMIGEPNGKSQNAYAGNIAYAHVLAVKKLIWPGDDMRVSGRAFFIGDDTPLTSFGKFVEPFLKSVDERMWFFKMPFWLMYSIAQVLTIVCWLISPFMKVDMPFHPASVRFLYEEHTFSWEGFRDAAGYSPKYSYEDSMTRSINDCKKFFGLQDIDRRKDK